MNKVLSMILCGLAGATIGGGITYVCVDKKFEKIFDSEIESYENELNELRGELTSLQKKVAIKNDTEKEKKAVPTGAVVPTVDPNSLIFKEESDGTEEALTVQESLPNDIRFISKMDYEDDDDYEKEEIEYYMFDGTITQDNEVLEDDEFENVCGTSALPLLRKDKSLARWSSADDNELYIRNEEYCTDYKIVRHHKAYDT